MKNLLIVVGLLLPLVGSFAVSAELRDVREAAIDSLRKTPKSDFPTDGVLLRASVASISCGLETRPQVVRIDVPPQHRGKTWAVAGQLFTIVNMKGVPPYISPSYATFETEPRVPQ